jgi:catechol 2,3-dioxygenase-like lactoylglutathione lyase family enzyme
MIKAVKFVTIPVRDQERALAFYTEKLGFEILTDQPHDEQRRWIELGLPGAETRIVLFPGRAREDVAEAFSNITFLSHNVVNTYKELRARGVEFAREPRTEPWGTSAVFRDTEGNTFALSSK